MSEAKLCPHCGVPLAVDGDHPRIEVPTHVGESTRGTVPLANLNESIPDMPLLAPGSNDDTFLNNPNSGKVVAAEPDPILGEFVASGSSVSTNSGVPKPVRSRRSGSSSNFPAINLETSINRSAVSTLKPAPPRLDEPEEEDEDEADEPRNGWSRVLLASYASAVTLALAWFVIKDRDREKPKLVETPKTTQGSQPPTNGDLSRKVQAPEPVEGEYLATLGRPIRVGSLEITPIDVKRRDVRLQRANVLSQPEQRDGGKKALVLRLKLQNTSEDTVFAPLDPAYLREHGEKLVDTFVNTANDGRIYPYHLAIESEWSIVGQDFAELRPGESKIVAIVTRPDAPPDEAGPFTWRVRLRTGINRTDAISLVWPGSVGGLSRPKEVGKK
jgi:hypothetical protein